MKIRTDYVSNSSSSSFILVFDNEAEKYSDEEFEALFPGMCRSDVMQLHSELKGRTPYIADGKKNYWILVDTDDIQQSFLLGSLIQQFKFGNPHVTNYKDKTF